MKTIKHQTTYSPIFRLCWMTALAHIRDINTSSHFLMTSSHTPPKYDRCLSPNATQSWQKSKAWWTTASGHQWTNRNVRTPWLPLAKKDDGVRVTSDLSPLNKYIIHDRHPLPRIEDLFLKLRGMSHYSKIDLRKGYYHIELDDKSKRFTATITPLGLMAYN